MRSRRFCSCTTVPRSFESIFCSNESSVLTVSLNNDDSRIRKRTVAAQPESTRFLFVTDIELEGLSGIDGCLKTVIIALLKTLSEISGYAPIIAFKSSYDICGLEDVTFSSIIFVLVRTVHETEPSSDGSDAYSRAFVFMDGSVNTFEKTPAISAETE